MSSGENAPAPGICADPTALPQPPGRTAWDGGDPPCQIGLVLASWVCSAYLPAQRQRGWHTLAPSSASRHHDTKLHARGRRLPPREDPVVPARGHARLQRRPPPVVQHRSSRAPRGRTGRGATRPSRRLQGCPRRRHVGGAGIRRQLSASPAPAPVSTSPEPQHGAHTSPASVRNHAAAAKRPRDGPQEHGRTSPAGDGSCAVSSDGP